MVLNLPLVKGMQEILNYLSKRVKTVCGYRLVHLDQPNAYWCFICTGWLHSMVVYHCLSLTLAKSKETLQKRCYCALRGLHFFIMVATGGFGPKPLTSSAGGPLRDLVIHFLKVLLHPGFFHYSILPQLFFWLYPHPQMVPDRENEPTNAMLPIHTKMTPSKYERCCPSMLRWWWPNRSVGVDLQALCSPFHFHEIRVGFHVGHSADVEGITVLLSTSKYRKTGDPVPQLYKSAKQLNYKKSLHGVMICPLIQVGSG